MVEDFNPGTLQVTFPVSSVEGNTVCGEIEAVDDETLECSHDFTVAIGSATLGTTTGSPSEAVVTILDNDSELTQGSEINCITFVTAPGLDFTLQPDFAAGEGDGTVDVCMLLSPPSGGMECDVVVELGLDSGKAGKC